MNHRAKSVVRDVIKGDKSRASYLFSQPLDGVEFLLERRTCISQDLEATEVGRAEGVVERNLRVRYKSFFLKMSIWGKQ